MVASQVFVILPALSPQLNSSFLPLTVLSPFYTCMSQWLVRQVKHHSRVESISASIYDQYQLLFFFNGHDTSSMKCVDVTYLGSINNANQDWDIIQTYNFKQWKKPHQMKCNSLTCKMLCLKTNSRNFCSENFCSLYLWLETCFCTY